MTGNAARINHTPHRRLLDAPLAHFLGELRVVIEQGELKRIFARQACLHAPALRPVAMIFPTRMLCHRAGKHRDQVKDSPRVRRSTGQDSGDGTSSRIESRRSPCASRDDRATIAPRGSKYRLLVVPGDDDRDATPPPTMRYLGLRESYGVSE